MSVSDSCALSRSVEERRSLSGKSFISWLHLWTTIVHQLRIYQRKRRGDPPRFVGSFKPVSASKPTVAWNLFAFLRRGERKREGAQDDDNCWETVVVRRLECACVLRKEIVMLCSFERGG